MLEHLSTEKANAAPVEILEPEPVIEEQQVDKRDDGGVFVDAIRKQLGCGMGRIQQVLKAAG